MFKTSNEETLFRRYSLYSWLSPLLLTFVLIITHNLDSETSIATKISDDQCFIDTGGNIAGDYY